MHSHWCWEGKKDSDAISLVGGHIIFSRYMVLKPKDKILIMKNVNNEIGHFGEAKMILKLRSSFFGMKGQTLLKSLSKFVIDVNWLDRLVILGLEWKVWK